MQQNSPFQVRYLLKVFLYSTAQITPGIGRDENRLASTRDCLWSAWPSLPPPWPPVDRGGGRGLRWFYPYCEPHWCKFWVTPYPMFVLFSIWFQGTDLMLSIHVLNTRYIRIDMRYIISKLKTTKYFTSSGYVKEPFIHMIQLKQNTLGGLIL